jgi:hypothetical protein
MISILLLLQINVQSADPLVRVVHEYFDLPRYVRTLGAPTSEQQEATFKQRLANHFREMFAGDLLSRYLESIASLSLETEDLDIVVGRVGDVRTLSVDASVASAEAAFVTTTASVRQIVNEEFGFKGVDDLFARFPIDNVTREDVDSQLRHEAVPESLSFSVESTKRYVFRLDKTRDGWRIAEVWDRVTHAHLTIERPH